LNNIDLIAESVEIIEKNLKEQFTVFDISKKLGYSYFHFSRLFKGVTGHCPSDYIVKRRLTEAASDLIHTKDKVIQIAYDYQFNSPEAFSRAFKRMFSISPLQMRKQKELTFFQMVNRLNVESIYHTREVISFEPEEMELDSFIVVGMSCFMKYEDTTITRIWQEFLSESSSVPNKVSLERYYQICFWPDTYDLGGIFLMAGIEVKDPIIYNDAYVLKVIPQSRYLRFIHKGLSNKVGLTYQYIYQNFLPKTTYRLPKSFNFEFYGEKFKGPNNPESESEIFIPVDN
jgi:AraC family transcriptional regulator